MKSLDKHNLAVNSEEYNALITVTKMLENYRSTGDSTAISEVSDTIAAMHELWLHINALID